MDINCLFFSLYIFLKYFFLHRLLLGHADMLRFHINENESNGKRKRKMWGGVMHQHKMSTIWIFGINYYEKQTFPNTNSVLTEIDDYYCYYCIRAAPPSLFMLEYTNSDMAFHGNCRLRPLSISIYGASPCKYMLCKLCHILCYCYFCCWWCFVLLLLPILILYVISRYIAERFSCTSRSISYRNGDVAVTDEIIFISLP